MPTDTTRGIRRLDDPCWTVVLADGTPAGFEESEPHYENEAEARKAAPDYEREDEPPVRVIQLDTCCWVADLLCGTRYVYEGSDSDAAHFADEQNLLTCIAEDNLFAAEPGVFACADDQCKPCRPYALPRLNLHIANKMIELGALALQFGRVPRATFHPDGKRIESDTDHTVMLGLIACALASEFFPQLNVGLVAQFILCHDLDEVYDGDTPTMRTLSPAAAADKEEKTRAATMRLHIEFHNPFPWVAHTTRWYQIGDTPEAAFVWAVDKILPKITHILNGGVTARAEGMTADELTVRYDIQREEIRRRAAAFPQLADLHGILVARMLDVVKADEQCPSPENGKCMHEDGAR